MEGGVAHGAAQAGLSSRLKYPFGTEQRRLGIALADEKGPDSPFNTERLRKRHRFLGSPFAREMLSYWLFSVKGKGRCLCLRRHDLRKDWRVSKDTEE